MNLSISETIQKLKTTYLEEGTKKSLNLDKLKEKLSSSKLSYRNITSYYDVLIFIAAHPTSLKNKNWALKELKRITNWCKLNSKKYEDVLDNSGLPYTNIYSFYSFELIQWLLKNKQILSIDNYPIEDQTLNEVLIHTFPISEHDIFQQELDNAHLISALKIKKGFLLDFIMGQFSKLNHCSSVRDYFFEKQKFSIKLEAKLQLSKSENRIRFDKTYIQKDWIKKLNTSEWIGNPIPEEKNLSLEEKNEVLKSSRIKLTILQRETDPVTYMDTNSIRYFQLERGIAIALFTMRTEKQLYPESYIGYTLYKNGYPAAYGGAWIFGKHALIGINIFEWFRGGESTFFFNQLLRLYHQQFNVMHFEVEPYQFGKDNPEGIHSGAFWFYYRMGFKPVDRTLATLAEKESGKIKINKEYRSKKSTLIQFTKSNLRLSLEKDKIIEGIQVKSKITLMIVKEFFGDRLKAEHECRSWLLDQLGGQSEIKNIMDSVVCEISLMNRAFNFPIKNYKELIKNMLKNKDNNLYQYQKNIIEWLQIVYKN